MVPAHEEGHILGDCSCISGPCGEPFNIGGHGRIKNRKPELDPNAYGNVYGKVR